MQGLFFALAVQIQKEGLFTVPCCRQKSPLQAAQKASFLSSGGPSSEHPFRKQKGGHTGRHSWAGRHLGGQQPIKHHHRGQRDNATETVASSPLIDDRKSIKTPLRLSHKFQSYD